MNILYWSLDRASIDRAYINSWILPWRMLWVAENISTQFALFYTSQIETQIKLFFVRTSKFCFLFGFTFFFSFSASFCSYLEVIVLYFRCSNCSQILFDSAHRNVYIYISVCYMYYLHIVHDMYHRYIMYGYPVYKILFMKIFCFS